MSDIYVVHSARHLSLLNRVFLAIATTLLVVQPADAETADLGKGRTLWKERATGYDGRWAAAEPITAAVAAFEEALAAAPNSQEAHEELLRSLYFQGSFTEITDEERKRIFARGTAVSASAMKLIHGSDELDWKNIDSIVKQARGKNRAGALHFWSAIHWGQWGDHHGAMAALRKGVADRLRVHGQAALELDPDYDEAGAYRLLGRMHAVAPKVPMFTGWINREKSVKLLEEAYRRFPRNPGNCLFVAEIWLERRPNKKAEALALVNSVLDTKPRPGAEVEDAFLVFQARETAATLEKSSAHGKR